MNKPTEKEILLSFLDELLSLESSKLVGKTMKRFELFENRDVLRRDIKELIYESFRELKDIFNAYGRGIDTIKWNLGKGGRK